MSIFQENVSLKSYNTFGIEAKARYFVAIKNEEELQAVFADPIAQQQPLLILGGGSNMLFTQDFDGLVIKMDIQGIAHEVNGNEVKVSAGGGVVWNDLVNYCVEHGFAGLENLSLIPGTVGASPIQNIGAYGVELKDAFSWCRAFEIATRQIKVFNYADCEFGYRDSVFKNALKGKYIITEVGFHLSLVAQLHTHYGAINDELANRHIADPTIADVSKVVSHIRVSKLPDPKTIGNAGSFFKNPVIEQNQFDQLAQQFPKVVNYPAAAGNIKLAAGWLIEQCGFKGIVVGHTGTWKNQALVLVNHGGATGQEVYNFSEQIINAVQDKFGVALEREVNIL